MGRLGSSRAWSLVCLATGAVGTPATANVGIFLKNIDQVDGKSGWWRGDVIINSQWWEASFPPDSQPQVGVVNAIIDFNDESRRYVNQGLVTRTVRDTGEFYFDGEYWLFPFDEQRLVVAVEALGMPSSELLLVADDAFSGIAPVNNQTGRPFSTAQFREVSWDIALDNDYRSLGMPYSKSRVVLSVVVKRHLPYYVFRCFVVPTFAVMCAMGVPHLPITPATPRIMVGFASFLAAFVHLRMMLSLLPQGVWCWLFSGLLFSMAILSLALLGDIASATVATIHLPSAQAHDRYCRWTMPAEYVVAFSLLIALKEYHVSVMIVCIACAFAVHIAGVVAFYRKAKSALNDELEDYSPREFTGGSRESTSMFDIFQLPAAGASFMVFRPLMFQGAYDTADDVDAGGDDGGDVM